MMADDTLVLKCRKCRATTADLAFVSDTSNGTHPIFRVTCHNCGEDYFVMKGDNGFIELGVPSVGATPSPLRK